MTDTSYSNSGLGRAPGYICFRDEAYEVAPFEVVPRAAGALTSTVVDMARWLLALLGHRPDVVPEAVRQTMLGTVYELAPGFGVGTGTFLDRRRGFLFIHTGGAPGATAIIATAPPADVGIVVLTNRDDRAPRPIHRRLTETVENFLAST